MTAPDSRPVEPGMTDVLLTGDFNPAIFAPLWFVTHDLLPAGADEAATEVVVTGVVTTFETGGLHVQVSREHLIVRLTGAEAAARDLAMGALRQLPHIPISRVQITRHWHLSGAGTPVWDALVPLDRWQDQADEVSLVELTVALQRSGPGQPQTACSIEPSDEEGADLHLVVADRFEFHPDTGDAERDASRLRDASSALAVLENEWAASQARGVEAANRMLDGLLPDVRVKAGT